ncbi:MAG: cysteine hydrolase [Lachnospiraceae bacterium]|nr:cysteine hydrolase [Lachnospiraceae bacterium]
MKTLVVVDMQKDFIDGALGTKEAVAIVDNVKKKIEKYRKEGNQIIFTRDTHGIDYLNTQEGKNLPVEHCIEGTEGWQIAKELEVRPEDTVINKISFGHNWYKDIENNPDFIKGDEIELVGLCTDICVISNALGLKTMFPERPITVDASCCAGVTPQSHTNALEAMKMCQISITA